MTAAMITAKRPTRARFVILALLAVGTMINYLDRTVLGIAAPTLTKELGLSAAVMGIVFSAFSRTYAAAQIPGGVFLDRFGARLTYFASVGLWSLFTLFHGFATGLYSLLFCRFGLGVSEAPCFPTNSRVVSTWFPQSERARATGVYTVGEYLGLACFSPLLFWLLGSFGWRSLFFVTGIAGVVFAVVWWFKEGPHNLRGRDGGLSGRWQEGLGRRVLDVRQAQADAASGPKGPVPSGDGLKRALAVLVALPVFPIPPAPPALPSPVSDRHAIRAGCADLP
jgi:MFS family permease